MNKKELAELKKNFNDKSGLFTLNRVMSVYVDSQKKIRCTQNRLYSVIPEDEGAVIMESLNKVLCGSLGKGLLEYAFPNEEYNEGGAENILYAAMRTKLADENASAALVQRIINNMQYESAYTVIIGQCSYSIVTRDKNDESLDSAADEFNFLVCAVCPANTGNDGLMFDDASNAIVKKSNTDLIISRIPTDGFMYPIFTDRCADINSVLYFTAVPKKPNITFIENVLGCEFTMSAQSEKETFQAVVQNVVGDELDYTVITKINEKLLEVVTDSKNETELPVVDDLKMYNILADSGVSDEKLASLKSVYNEKVAGGTLIASNLVESRTKVSTPEITINISKNATDKLHTRVIEGRHCLIIDLDDPSVCVNGLNTQIK